MIHAVYSGSQLRQIDAHSIETLGVPGIALMETAGRAVASFITRELAAEAARGVLVVAGRGNNGGDGYVVARLLHLHGLPVRVLGMAGDASPDCATMRRAAQGVGVEIADEGDVADAGLVVDALLGTGLKSDVRGQALARIQAIRRAAIPTLAVDMPSGVCGDTGRVMGEAVEAAVTVTFEHPRVGQLLEPGVDHAGRLVVASIGLVGRAPPVAMIPDGDFIAGLIPARAANSHKGNHGHLGVLAGSRDKAGAAALVCNAAIRAGCGLVTLVVGPQTAGRLPGLRPEVMLRVLENPRVRDLEDFDALAVGPGRGLDREARDLMRQIWFKARPPAIFDADGLTAMAGAFQPSSHPRCITPHPGEAGRLLRSDSRSVQADRLGAIGRLSDIAPTLLKGRHTLVSGAPVALNPTGGPQLATAGSGDVLTGVVGAFLARGMSIRASLISAAFVHGLAGELAGPYMVAGDLVDHLPRAFAALADRGGVVEWLPLL